ncbi:MAG: Arc family DNA-binding protein [Pseudomonadota bacterium]
MSQVTRTQVRIPTDLMEWIKQMAREQNRSMNGQLVEMLEQLKRQAV